MAATGHHPMFSIAKDKGTVNKYKCDAVTIKFQKYGIYTIENSNKSFNL